MSLVNIKQIRNLPSASNGAVIVFNGSNNIWSNTDTNGIAISSGTTAERPLTPTPGFIRYNTDINLMEYWNGSNWIYIKDATRKYTRSFNQSDLVANILTVTHNLNDDWCTVTVYDNSRQVIIPTSVVSVDANNIDIDLSTFVTISGTWHAVVVGG